jgi:hypothetical protein
MDSPSVRSLGFPIAALVLGLIGAYDAAAVSLGFTGTLRISIGPDSTTTLFDQAVSETGSFSALTTAGGGPMGIAGDFTLSVFGSPLVLATGDGGFGHGIGLGGSFLAQVPPGSLNIELFGSPWTTGTVTNGFGSVTGFAAGNDVRLVTGFGYISSIGASGQTSRDLLQGSLSTEPFVADFEKRKLHRRLERVRPGSILRR